MPGSTRRYGIGEHCPSFPACHALPAPLAPLQEGSRYERVKSELMIQLEDVAQSVLLLLRLSMQATPAELVLNRLQTPYQA